MLLQLLRGTGVQGLAGMPRLTPFGAGWLARPLLVFSRRALEHYARAEKLRWIEDPSNRDLRHGRNLLRHNVFRCYRGIGRQRRGGWPRQRNTPPRPPACWTRWPVPTSVPAGSQRGLQVPALAQLPAPRRRNVLRYWIRERGFQTPATALLERISALVDSLPRTRQAEIRWGGVALHRYRDLLMLHPASLAPQPNRRPIGTGARRYGCPRPACSYGCCRRREPDLHVSVSTVLRCRCAFAKAASAANFPGASITTNSRNFYRPLACRRGSARACRCCTSTMHSPPLATAGCASRMPRNRGNRDGPWCWRHRYLKAGARVNYFPVV